MKHAKEKRTHRCSKTQFAHCESQFRRCRQQSNSTDMIKNTKIRTSENIATTRSITETSQLSRVSPFTVPLYQPSTEPLRKAFFTLSQRPGQQVTSTCLGIGDGGHASQAEVDIRVAVGTNHAHGHTRHNALQHEGVVLQLAAVDRGSRGAKANPHTHTPNNTRQEGSSRHDTE